MWIKWFYFFMILLFASCGIVDFDEAQSKTVEINGNDTILLCRVNSEGYVHAIKLKISGNISDSTVFSFLAQKPTDSTSHIYKNRVSDDFLISRSGDWYSDSIFIIINGVDTSKSITGKIDFEYEFIGM